MKVLIIDDELSNVELVRAFLRAHDIQIISAYTGIDGFELAYVEQPDLIFVDLLMPDITWTGYETAQNLVSDVRTAHIPVVALTAAGNRQKALGAGCLDVLNRPFRRKQLEDVLFRYSGV